jgi:hypothetical protein
MDRMLGRNGLRAAGAAVLVFAALLLGAPTPSAASSYTLAYTGTVTSTPVPGGGLFHVLGIVPGDPVSGTFTFDTLNENRTSVSGSDAEFDQGSASFTFHVSHPGKLDMTQTVSGDGLIRGGGDSSASGLEFSLHGSDADMIFNFITDHAGGPLLSLAGLPNSPSALLAFLGGTPTAAYGRFYLNNFGGEIKFDLALAATTPIPAALPLFISALGGLGYAGWRRRKRSQAA